MADYGDSDGRTGCCRCCFSFILTLGLTSLFLWLSLRASNPVLSIQDVYIPTLNKTLNSSSYQSIYLDLKLDNENKDKGIYYDPINVTLFFFPNGSKTLNPEPETRIRIGDYNLRGFYQGHQKKTRRKNWVETYGGMKWDEVRNGGGGMVVFRVVVETRVRFKILVWKTKRHGLVVGGEFRVDDGGKKVEKKGTRLKKSGAGVGYSGGTPVGLGLGFGLVGFCILVLV